MEYKCLYLSTEYCEPGCKFIDLMGKLYKPNNPKECGWDHKFKIATNMGPATFLVDSFQIQFGNNEVNCVFELLKKYSDDLDAIIFFCDTKNNVDKIRITNCVDMIEKNYPNIFTIELDYSQKSSENTSDCVNVRPNIQKIHIDKLNSGSILFKSILQHDHPSIELLCYKKEQKEYKNVVNIPKIILIGNKEQRSAFLKNRSFGCKVKNKKDRVTVYYDCKIRFFDKNCKKENYYWNFDIVNYNWFKKNYGYKAPCYDEDIDGVVFFIDGSSSCNVIAMTKKILKHSNKLPIKLCYTNYNCTDLNCTDLKQKLKSNSFYDTVEFIKLSDDYENDSIVFKDFLSDSILFKGIFNDNDDTNINSVNNVNNLIPTFLAIEFIYFVMVMFAIIFNSTGFILNKY